MRAQRRGTLALALVLLLAAGLPAVPPAAGAGTGEAAVTTVSPQPGAVVTAGRVGVGARLHAARPVAAVQLTVDGEPIPATVGDHDAVAGTPVRAAVHLAPGNHTLRLDGRDAGGARLERAWQVTATDRSVRRFAGPSRVDTAVATSAAAYPAAGSAPAAVLARADDFADALAGVPLAAAVDGPLLLSRNDALSAATAAELRRVVRAGGTVHLLGGEGALAAAVAGAVVELGLRAERHGGEDRYATAAVVAGALPASPGAILASGTAFPDALAASAPAAARRWPVLLTTADRLPEPTATALAARAVGEVTIVGGAAAVSVDVERHARRVAPTVVRVAGPDRYATAAAVAEAFSGPAGGLSLASGVDFPDALSGTRHAVLLDQPLLLTRPTALPAATAAVLRARRPDRVDVYGGTAAVSDHAAQEALHAAVDGPHAPRVADTAPAAGQTVAALEAVTVRFDRPVDPHRSSVYVEVAGVEVGGDLVTAAATDTLTFRPDEQAIASLDTPWPGRAVVRAVTPDGAVGHHVTAFTFLRPDPFYATAGGVALYLPSRGVDMIGFHESTHPGAQQQVERPTATPRTTLASRLRGTGSHTAADVVADPALPVLAPVTGRVVRAGPYVLYCRYSDDYAVIEPDARPGWEVKVLHFHGLRVRPGDRVVAHETVLGDGPRVLPFESQVDHVAPTRWPHVHVEVVDPSIPPRPGSGC